MALKGTASNILQSPGQRRRPFVSHACCHYIYTGPSICLIPLWAARVRRRNREICVCFCVCVCEVFITTGISLFPLIPSLGSRLLFIFRVQWLHLHTERRAEWLTHLLLYALWWHFHLRYTGIVLSSGAAYSVTCTLFALRAWRTMLLSCSARGSLQSSFLSLAWRMPPQNTDLFSLQLRGPVTAYRSHSPGFAMYRGYLNGKLG